MSEIDYKKKYEAAEAELQLYKKDAVYGSYYALNKIVNQMVNRLNKFNLEIEIGKDAKEDKVYDRTKAIWEKLPEMQKALNEMKKDFGDDEAKHEGKLVVVPTMTSPESIASVLQNR